jgi:hypothetical protein
MDPVPPVAAAGAWFDPWNKSEGRQAHHGGVGVRVPAGGGTAARVQLPFRTGTAILLWRTTGGPIALLRTPWGRGHPRRPFGLPAISPKGVAQARRGRGNEPIPQ